ncbi:hypothetical protein CK203_100886 [Vitis vinifera]|uniref:Integrase catalytic domain-containing protein n=1 Tax=Vitis vinifera TaxID=29760 RepID=A0A438CZJ1_VITVI|nr:hypothetical protein CK203_100886 [Vitis vinifera]
MYLAVSEWAISVVLFRCPSPKEQKPIYYVSRALADVETRYSKMELTALALRSAAQKLRPYFQAHPVIVLTDQPLRNILHKPDLTGRMLQWAIELSEFGIEFQPRLSMKGQVMADFVLEYSRRPSQHHESSKQEWWTLRVDGASRSSGSGVGLLLQSPTGEHLEQAIRLGFSASNNEAEYEAILSGLDLALALSVSKLRIYSDSQLVVRHVQKEYEAKDARMARYLAKLPPSHQRSHSIAYTCANQPLCRRISTCNTIEETKRTIKNGRTTLQNISGQAPTRRSQTGTQNPGASCPFHLIGGHLYKRSFTGPYLRCLGHSEAQYAPIPHMPSATLKSSQAHGPCAMGHGHSGTPPSSACPEKFLLVATDYLEVADNGPQFDSIAFRNFCSELNIRNSYSTPRYPQSNGQAEATNKTLITALKKRLEQAKGKWVEELPVLWAYRTTPGRPTGNTPFALAYGMDAVIPTEIGLPTIRTDAAKQNDANTELGRNLDWTDEVRESAAIRMADYQQRASAHYNRKVRPRSFKNGTLVLRKVFENTAEWAQGNSKLTGKDPI